MTDHFTVYDDFVGATTIRKNIAHASYMNVRSVHGPTDKYKALLLAGHLRWHLYLLPKTLPESTTPLEFIASVSPNEI